MPLNSAKQVEPICYFDEKHGAAKHHRLNPHSRSSDETLGIMEKHFTSIGLTRLIDLTGQDRIGMPVYNAVKPGMINYSVQHGKGMTRKDAKLSAIMESFERYYGSCAELSSFSATYNDAGKHHIMIPFEKLAKTKASLFHRDMTIEWTVGYDIVNREPVAVPLDLALLRPHTSARRLPLLQASSNGLASATNFAEAVSQGLLELFERDAITCDHHRSAAAGKALPLDLIRWRSVDHPVIRPLLETIHAADIIPLLFSCEVDTRIPTYNCYIANKKNPSEGFFHGMGAGMDEATAMIRAITEAVQARSALRSGTRDIFFHNDALFHSLSNPGFYIDQLGGEDAGRDLSEFADYATHTFEGDINVCLERLAAIGLNQVIVLRLTPEDLDYIVVRVMVPGLEGYMLPLYSPGKRAMAMMEEKKS